MFETDVMGQPLVVEDLDADWILALLEDKEAAARQAERGKLRLAGRWCVLHPATADTGVATWGDAGLPGLRACDETLGGEGTPLVAAFSPEPFAAALGLSTYAGMQLLADALDLRHRLPRIWGRVEALAVAPWKARKVAQATRPLSRPAAAYVDAELAERIGSCGATAIERVVAAAVARFHPELLAERERRGRAGWHVTLHHGTPGGAGGFAGTSYLDVAGDTLDLTRFYALVCERAAALAAAGDTDPLEARKAKALGALADQHPQPDLFTPTDDQPAGDQPAEQVESRGAKTSLYLHLSLTDLLGLTDDTTGPGETRTGTVEKLGPATLAKIREWVGHSQVTIRPVLDLARPDALDAHDPPEWLRELVILRDRHCVFPWCSRDARACDLDHIDPYLPMDEGGPPGQTRDDNLAPLCRRHHRCKTSGRWRYRRNPDGTYLWQAPQGRAYAVTPNGTLTLSTN